MGVCVCVCAWHVIYVSYKLCSVDVEGGATLWLQIVRYSTIRQGQQVDFVLSHNPK